MRSFGKQSVLVGAVALAVCTLANSAHASLVGYSNVTSNGITISAIQEDNNDNFGPGHYGQPVFSNGVLTFPSINQFFATQNGDASSHSTTLRAKLTFTVTMPSATAALFNLNEGGIFQGYAGGSGSVVAGVVVTDANHNVITVNPSTATVIPAIPFFAPSPTPATTFTWSATLNPVATNALVTYTVSLDNDLTATAPAVTINPTFAYVDKKSLTISFPGGGNPVPEPASLGVLVLGGAALLARRRRA